MKDLANNQTSICQRSKTVVEIFTKVMHFVATTLYFLQVNKEEKDLGKATKTTQSIYGFLWEDWLKTISDKLVKVEGEDAYKDALEEKEEEKQG